MANRRRPIRDYRPILKAPGRVDVALEATGVNQNPGRLGFTTGKASHVYLVSPMLAAYWRRPSIRAQFERIGVCIPCKNGEAQPISKTGWCLKHEVFGVYVTPHGRNK